MFRRLGIPFQGILGQYVQKLNSKGERMQSRSGLGGAWGLRGYTQRYLRDLEVLQI